MPTNAHAGQRYTAKGTAKQRREDHLVRRIRLALRAIGWHVDTLTERLYDRVRDNGVNLRATCGDYRADLCIVLPGRRPDVRQRAYIASCPYALPVSSVAEAVHALSLGLVLLDTPKSML